MTVTVAALAAPTIELSELALGSRSVPLPWRISVADTAWINPLHQFRSSEPMQLFFEVGGLPIGKAYRWQFAILKAGAKDPQLQIGFNAAAASAPDKIRREIDIGRLGSGKYVLQVTVSTAEGAKSVRQREFTVVK